ncbi:uncharacterized protein LOC143033357 [Oratosquilla oratoria]|uniref:uncharacterized protein LOC143033357 n=1 Tax=Oratosquilla oratoria TaxID=337810 RepID=UPI003F75CF59
MPSYDESGSTTSHDIKRTGQISPFIVDAQILEEKTGQRPRASQPFEEDGPTADTSPIGYSPAETLEPNTSADLSSTEDPETFFDLEGASRDDMRAKEESK